MGLFGGGGDSGADEMMAWLKKGRKAYTEEMRPVADLGFKGYQEIGALLGLEGDRDAAIERFQQTPGLQFARDEASKATSRQAASSGLTGSGNVLAALQERSMNLSNQQFGTYLSQLGTFAQPGLTAKQNIADMEMNYAQQMGQAAMADAQSSGGGFDLAGAIGGGLSGFATGGWGGAALGALGGGMSGGGGGFSGGMSTGGGFGSLSSGIGSLFSGGGSILGNGNSPYNPYGIESPLMYADLG